MILIICAIVCTVRQKLRCTITYKNYTFSTDYSSAAAVPHLLFSLCSFAAVRICKNSGTTGPGGGGGGVDIVDT